MTTRKKLYITAIVASATIAVMAFLALTFLPITTQEEILFLCIGLGLPLLFVWCMFFISFRAVVTSLEKIHGIILSMIKGKLGSAAEKAKPEPHGEFFGIEEDLALLGEKVRQSYQQLERVVEDKIHKIAEQNATYSSVLASIGDGLIATDRKGIVIFVNTEAERMLGWRGQELLGRNLLETIEVHDDTGTLMRTEDRPIAKSLLGTNVRIPASKPVYFKRKDGTLFPAALSSSPVIDSGTVIGAVEVFKDITSDVEIERAKNEFVSLASHQLRTPPTAVKWYTESLLSHPANFDEKQKKYLQEIYKNNKRMISLVNSLLNVSRVELGEFLVEPHPLDLRDAFRVVLSELRPQIQQKGIIVGESFPDDLPTVNLDQKLTIIILQNLLTNAIKYSAEGGKILIGADVGHNEITIRVADTGCGIPPHQHHKIFTKLFRADNANDHDPDGSGLGLYITKSIVDRTGGSIRFESVIGAGTTFYVSFPLSGMRNNKAPHVLVV